MPRVDLDARRDSSKSAPLPLWNMFRDDGERYGPGWLVMISQLISPQVGGVRNGNRVALGLPHRCEPLQRVHTRVASVGGCGERSGRTAIPDRCMACCFSDDAGLANIRHANESRKG